MKHIITGPEVVQWVASRTSEYGRFRSETAIGLVQDNAIIAGVVYADFNGPNVVTHIAAIPTRQWMTRPYLWSIFSYPFDLLNVKRITACVGEGNKDSRKFVEHLGFKLEATLKECHPTGRLFIYRLLKSECRFLGICDREKNTQGLRKNAALRVAA